jgi:hypothetical protein
MSDTENAALRPMGGSIFEDILDGYFPIRESARQLLERQGASAMWIRFVHAPVMTVSGLSATEPVPMSVRKAYSGMIDHMTLFVARSGDRVEVSGVGDWYWADGREETDTLPASTRMGEPVFVRGIGIRDLAPGNLPSIALTNLNGSLSSDVQLKRASDQLGWSEFRAWEIQAGIGHIRRVHEEEGLAIEGWSAEPVAPAKLPVPGERSLHGPWSHVLADVSAARSARRGRDFARHS